jgi:peptidoglycan glycosyltransferase
MGRGEVLVTPFEMALVVATAANDGVQSAPRLVLDIGGEGVPAPSPPRRVLSAETAAQMQDILAQTFVVGRQTASLPAADVAGRGGPADSGLPGAPPHAWFVGFAPAARPRYAIAVIVEHGDWGCAIQVLAQATTAE